MSRIGNKSIALPDKVKVNVGNDRAVACYTHHVYAQLTDDEGSKTLAATSTMQTDLAGRQAAATRQATKRVAKAIQEKLLAKKVENVVVDRGGYIFHGKVKALADA